MVALLCHINISSEESQEINNIEKKPLSEHLYETHFSVSFVVVPDAGLLQDQLKYTYFECAIQEKLVKLHDFKQHQAHFYCQLLANLADIHSELNSF